VSAEPLNVSIFVPATLTRRLVQRVQVTAREVNAERADHPPCSGQLATSLILIRNISGTACLRKDLPQSEIDRRLAAGEPSTQIARDYELNLSSLHRHRINCLKLGSSNAIMKDAARGSAAVALLPSKETLSDAYFELRTRIDQIVAQAEQQGSLAVAVSGLNSLRQTLDSLARLAGHTAGAQVNVAVQTNLQIDLSGLLAHLIEKFDNEPALKARIAAAVLEIDDEQSA
jgi:hypothetical protein